MSLNESYRNQPGCHNCGHVFVLVETDNPLTYCCTLNAPPRPLCMSLAMREHIPWSSRNHKRTVDAWESWSDCRWVKAWGICDKWKEGE